MRALRALRDTGRASEPVRLEPSDEQGGNGWRLVMRNGLPDNAQRLQPLRPGRATQVGQRRHLPSISLGLAQHYDEAHLRVLARQGAEARMTAQRWKAQAVQPGIAAQCGGRPEGGSGASRPARSSSNMPRRAPGARSRPPAWPPGRRRDCPGRPWLRRVAARFTRFNPHG
jgi:hypothetical protein